MPSPLLAVKFFIPKPRPALTERPQLLDRFMNGLARPLTLISAPAGFGKSTILSAWLDKQAVGANLVAPTNINCWLSLDSADNHIARFWTYLIAAIQTGFKKWQKEKGGTPNLRLDHLLEDLQSEPPPPIPTVLDEWINAISACSEQFLLVLDDYQVIQTPEIHEQMTYLLDHQPPNLRLVISTRVDPALPITRLRARGQLSEFRVADLRFTVSETADFFKTNTGVAMAGEELSAIQASTEGWVAGLQMAALALQAVMTENSARDAAPLYAEVQQGKIKEFVGSFSGKNLYILDYLTDEVFNHQPAEVQTFLLKTSILERMSADLCEAVLGAGAAADGAAPAKAKAILDYLEKSNLFLIRLDNERHWFRYHHLFADLLRARLEQTLPAMLPELHQNASHWYQQNGLVEDAIQHALAAKDWEWAARLMEMHVTAYLEQGQLATVLKWIDSLPSASLRSRPALCTQVAEALAHAGRFQRVPPLLDMIETTLSTWDGKEEEYGAVSLTQRDLTRMRGIVAMLRAFGGIVAGKPEQALQLGKNALETISGLEPRELAWLNWVCGYAYRGVGQLDQAIHCYEIAFTHGRKAKTMLEDISTDLGIAYRLSGKLTQAVEVFQNALREAEAQGMRKKGNLSRVEAFLSAVLCDMNRLDEALEHAQKGIDYLQWWPSHNHITTAYIYLGQALLGLGRLDEAAEAIGRAEQEQHKGQVMPIVLRLVETISVRLWLQRGNWDLVERWLSGQATTLPNFGEETKLFNENEEMHLVLLARVWIAKGRKEAAPRWFEQALQLLAQLETPAKRSHWVHALIEIHLLQAVALHELGKYELSRAGNALDALTDSLQLGLPAGYLRIYLQEGAVAADMLQAWLKSAAARTNRADLKPTMVKHLLDSFGLGQPAETSKASGAMIEKLTEREQEVLQLLALGLSNKDMAQRMVVSEGTIKTHVHNLIGKLGAQSRTHVLARAKELGLL